MPNSMTGFGQAEALGAMARYKVEMKTVNHRYLDIAVRMPRDIQVLEERVRRHIQQRLSRGRVDVYISRQVAAEENTTVLVDRSLALAYLRALVEVRDFCGLKEEPDLKLLSGFSDILRVEKKEADLDEIWEEMEPVVSRAAEALSRQRQAEGDRLSHDIEERLFAVEELAGRVEARAPLVVEDYRRKLSERLAAFLESVEIDQARLLTEAAIFADRSSIAEELVRLASHLTACRQALKEKGAVGRKLEFLTQELFREANTIGSKANDYETARLVVEIKTELEKVREQVQNIE